MPSLPTGTVTFLFTDLEGSTRLWEELPEAMREALGTHDAIVRDAIESHGGVVFSEMGDGMAAAFASPTDAVQAAVTAQQGLAAGSWPETGPLRARMGLHAGAGELRRDGQYVNQPLNRCARLMAIAHGGQVVVSGAVESLVRGALPADVTLIDLGEHRLRDLTHALGVFQVVHPGLSGEFPPLRSLSVLPGNLPRQVTTFVGRDAEIAGLADLVCASSLVTLTGVGGVGKTRLALQVAAEAVADFPDGAWMCPFAPVTDPGAVWEALAASLRVQAFQGRSLEESVLEYLTAKRLLLVLDNCEHLLDAIARQVDAITQRCLRVSLLATSREGLALAGERIVAVRSLEVPADGDAGDALLRAEAVQLFSDRATAAKDDFMLSERNATAVGVLCRRLDGIPLAIELAAARVRSLSPDDLVARLDRRFKLLTGGSRAALERHQTLRSTIDWSYDLLEPAEQQVLDRLSVFAGGCDLAAAEAVLTDDDLDVLDVVDALGHLVDKSLVIADTGDDGAVRYRLLESIRQYARERLEAGGDTPRVRRRHADHYVDVAETATPHLRSPDQIRWAEALVRETDNFRVVLDWAVETASPEHTYRMIAPLTMHGLPIAYTATDWAETAIGIPGGEEDPLFVVVASWAGWGATLVGDLERAAVFIAAAERSQDRSGAPAASLLRARGVVAFFVGDVAQALADADAWVALARASEDHFGLSDALILLASVRFLGFRGSHGEATPDDALALFDEAVRASRDAGIPSSLALNLSTVAGFLPVEESDRALALLEEAIDVGVASGGHLAVTLALAARGRVAALAGEWRTALRAAVDAADHQVELGDSAVFSGSLVLAAVAFSALGQHEPAIVLLGTADAIGTANMLPYEAWVIEAEAASREGVGEEQAATLKARGAALEIDAAVAYLRTEADRVLEPMVD